MADRLIKIRLRTRWQTDDDAYKSQSNLVPHSMLASDIASSQPVGLFPPVFPAREQSKRHLARRITGMDSLRYPTTVTASQCRLERRIWNFHSTSVPKPPQSKASDRCPLYTKNRKGTACGWMVRRGDDMRINKPRDYHCRSVNEKAESNSALLISCRHLWDTWNTCTAGN